MFFSSPYLSLLLSVLSNNFVWYMNCVCRKGGPYVSGKAVALIRVSRQYLPHMYFIYVLYLLYLLSNKCLRVWVRVCCMHYYFLWLLMTESECSLYLYSRHLRVCCIHMCVSGGHFKNTYELLNLRALKFSPVNKMGKIYFVRNFKGTLWNSTQNIIPIHWKVWFSYNIEILRALRVKSSDTFLKRPQVIYQIRSSDNDSTGFWPPGSLHTLGADGHI